MSLKLQWCHSKAWVRFPIRSPSIVTVAVSVAVCEILRIKKWRDLENQVRGRSRSLKIMPLDRLCDFLLVGHCKYSAILYHFRVI